MSQNSALIFGSSPAALLMARRLEEHGLSVKLLDAGNHFQKESPKFIVPDLYSVPAIETFKQALNNYSSLAMLPLDISACDLSPLTFEDGAFTSFLGFGDKKHVSIPAISRHHVNTRLVTNPPYKELLRSLLNRFQGEILSFSEISKITCDGSNIQSVEINGAKTYTADLYVFADAPRNIIRLLPTDTLSQKDWAKLNRAFVWSRLSVEIELPKNDLAHNETLFLIPNSTDFEPWVGAPHYPTSLWTCYLSDEKVDDPELVSSEIRQLKKLLHKVFPSLNEESREPGIHLLPEAVANYSWMDKGSIFESSLQNSLFISELLSDYSGLPASLDVVEGALARLKARTNTAQENISHNPSILSANPLP
jgi:2-polyprenyl-6-methoxyphenol hydroxylase-like FAD-dependent oxidoreductase